VKHLPDHGCSANSKTTAEVEFKDDEEDGGNKGKDEEDDDAEPDTGLETSESCLEVMTVLIWAVSRCTVALSENVIMEILADGREGQSSIFQI
jgi:hypothetical protein